jgi:hypothetical protein
MTAMIVPAALTVAAYKAASMRRSRRRAKR